MQRGSAPEAAYCCFFHDALCRQVTVFGRAPIKYVLLETVVGAKYLLSGIALDTTFKSCPPTRHISTGRKTCHDWRVHRAPESGL